MGGSGGKRVIGVERVNGGERVIGQSTRGLTLRVVPSAELMNWETRAIAGAAAPTNISKHRY
jgi:hypothetical protein